MHDCFVQSENKKNHKEHSTIYEFEVQNKKHTNQNINQTSKAAIKFQINYSRFIEQTHILEWFAVWIHELRRIKYSIYKNLYSLIE